ncbi:hypothetical protein GPECTOR_45g158 [Gonium pectorale]|uniref:diphthine methyl ester synthase n=1 Tax=Gonium pectorale TaxID=33097 RepID=A0A150G8Y5_GONPE|nr:hypothetical protein GPECTOR_45g158 [Gonium pectorale]|eukprot:KXZ46288.1 hypothetical protein GPECTOR_45g158 [Gonium pectorale]
MVLYLVGLGLYDEHDITLRGLEAVRRCSRVYLEAYTSILLCGKEKLEALYGKEVIVADREMVESRAEEILEGADTGDVAFCVVGDPFGATTHTDLQLRARERGIRVAVVHNASVMNAVGACGLSLYRFGEVKEPNLASLARGKIVYEPPRYMSINTAIEQLLEVEEARRGGALGPDSLAVGIARLQVDFGPPLHCLVLAGDVHVTEEEMLAFYRIREGEAAGSGAGGVAAGGEGQGSDVDGRA